MSDNAKSKSKPAPPAPEPVSVNLEVVQHPQPLAVPEPQQLEVRDPESILRFAVEKGATVDTIERLMVVRRELKAEQAKRAFDQALSRFQSECPVIVKRKAVADKGGGVRYRYAPLDDIVMQLRALDLFRKYGFSYSLTAEVTQNRVKAICKITHEAGHEASSAFEVPIDPKAFMNEQQKFAAALTYAKRYCFCNAFGILTGDEDTDAAGTEARKHGPLEAAKRRLFEVTYPVHNGDEPALELWLVKRGILGADETVAGLTPARLGEVLAAAEKAAATAVMKSALEPELNTLKKELWNATAKVHDNALDGAQVLERWLVDAGILGDQEELAQLSADRLREIIPLAKKKLSAAP